MRRIVIGLAVWLSCLGVSSAAQNAAPQTARQALLEMFFSKTPGTLVKHLPAATIEALGKSGAIAGLQQYSLLAGQIQAQGMSLQTFETGSILLSTDNTKTGQRFEVTVENDALRGDEDDLELSFQTYKDGQAQRTPFMPRMTFSMKQEAQVWKLNEISVTIRVPLADPDFLKAITEKMKPQVTATSTFTPREQTPAQTPAQTASSDAMVLAAMRSILTAETTYATTYPRVGYTCTLSDLDGFGSGEPNEHQAMLINSGLASGKHYGFVFTLSGCSGSPASSFRLSAAPNANMFGRKAFCADHSGTVRASLDGNVDRCWSSGVAQ
ncbi:MAG TPA: hypothetical protein VMP68_25230 [Candidatus Eisenbacteria bacterium]|nr:hypothetical protein [Candidatus Eisenbacteria bacterium]